MDEDNGAGDVVLIMMINSRWDLFPGISRVYVFIRHSLMVRPCVCVILSLDRIAGIKVYVVTHRVTLIP